MAAVVGFVYTAVAIVARASIITSKREERFEDIALFHWDVGALFAIPIIVFGFNCHANVVTIFRSASCFPAHSPLQPLKTFLIELETQLSSVRIDSAF